jgi:hypothetical protein
MLITTKDCHHLRLRGIDGDFGHAREFFLDDRTWSVRYLVADSAGWLRGRRVLLSPHALHPVLAADHVIPVDLTRQQVEDSPASTSEEPITRRFESAYHRYFGWPSYWMGGTAWSGGYPWLGVVPPVPDPRTEDRGQDQGDPHLRSTADFIGAHVEAVDGGIGDIADLVIDDGTWSLAYLVVDTGTWWPERAVAIPRHWLDGVNWDGTALNVNLTRDLIRQAPELPSDHHITAEHEAELIHYYESHTHAPH